MASSTTLKILSNSLVSETFNKPSKISFGTDPAISRILLTVIRSSAISLSSSPVKSISPSLSVVIKFECSLAADCKKVMALRKSPLAIFKTSSKTPSSSLMFSTF